MTVSFPHYNFLLPPERLPQNDDESNNHMPEHPAISLPY